VRHVVESPRWLLWLFVRPEKRAMARWNRLEQAEVAAQTSSLNRQRVGRRGNEK
jgi:hypothetical protein